MKRYNEKTQWKDSMKGYLGRLHPEEIWEDEKPGQGVAADNKWKQEIKTRGQNQMSKQQVKAISQNIRSKQ